MLIENYFKAYVPMGVRKHVADIRRRGIYGGYRPKQQCLFIHIPRTGGASVARALFDNVSSHSPYFIYQSAFPGAFARLFKFCFVRNPWDRLVSAFHFLKQGGMNVADSRWSGENIAQYRSFHDFVCGWVNEANIWTYVHFFPQCYFVCDPRGTPVMDLVGRFEDMESAFDILRALKANSYLSKTNSSKHDDYMKYYDNETVEIVARVYASDISTFDYFFERPHYRDPLHAKLSG